MGSDKTTHKTVPIEGDSRKGRLLDGVGPTGTLLVGLLTLGWLLASNWVIGWSWTGALVAVVMAILTSVVGYRQRAIWHARRLHNQGPVMPLGRRSVRRP